MANEHQKAREVSKVIRDTEDELLGLSYEKTPFIKRKTKKGNKVKTIQTTKLETFKTIIITALLVGIAAFLAGMHYEARKTEQVKSEVNSMLQMMKIEKEKQIVKQ